MYEWKWFEFGPGALSRRIGIAFLAWVAANALCMIVTGPQSHLSVDVLGTVVVAGGFAVWLGLLVRLVAPGIFVAADRVKIRNSWWTHVLLSRDIAGFERGPSPPSSGIRPEPRRSGWCAATGAASVRRYAVGCGDSILGADRLPGPKLTNTELDAVVSKLNQWLADSNA